MALCWLLQRECYVQEADEQTALDASKEKEIAANEVNNAENAAKLNTDGEPAEGDKVPSEAVNTTSTTAEPEAPIKAVVRRSRKTKADPQDQAPR